MVILQALPQHSEAQTLAVMHVSLAGIISQNSVDHDLLLSLIEPPVLAAEWIPIFARCLSRAWGQVKP